jgi:hypothetical protein
VFAFHDAKKGSGVRLPCRSRGVRTSAVRGDVGRFRRTADDAPVGGVVVIV